MLKTRLDGRSEDNSSFQIMSPTGEVIATVKVQGENSTTMEISTKPGLYISKPNGWSSKKVDRA